MHQYVSWNAVEHLGLLSLGQPDRLPVEAILGLTQAQTTARYTHLAHDPIQSASDRVASSLQKVLEG